MKEVSKTTEEIIQYIQNYKLNRIRFLENKDLFLTKILLISNKINTQKDYKLIYLREFDRIILSTLINRDETLERDVITALYHECLPIINKLVFNKLDDYKKNELWSRGYERFWKNLLNKKIHIQNYLIFNKETGRETRLTSYLYSVFWNILMEMLREDNKVRPFLESDDFDSEDIIDFDEPQSIEEKKQMAKDKAMQLLSENCKKSIELYYYAKLTHVEISQQLQLRNADTSKATKQRCLKKLKQLSIQFLNN